MRFDWHADNGAAALSKLDQLLQTAPVTRRERRKHMHEGMSSLAQGEDPATALLAIESADEKTLAGELIPNWRQRAGVPEAPLIDLLTSAPTIAGLPVFSWRISFRFELASPLFTRSDDIYYPIDNGFRRDRALNQPIFTATSWKGCLLAAWRALYAEENSSARIRLFGSDDDDYPSRGRLIFSTSFFQATAFEVINPHERATKKGLPIFYEVVPRGEKGIFSLQFCNFSAATLTREEIAAETGADLKLLGQALPVAFHTFGFGAKTSSGFGQAEDAIRGSCEYLLPGAESKTSLAAVSKEPLARYLKEPGVFQPEYLNPDGSFRVRTDLASLKKADKLLYEKARSAWERMQKEKEAADRQKSEQPARIGPLERPVHIATAKLERLSTLSSTLGTVAEAMLASKSVRV